MLVSSFPQGATREWYEIRKVYRFLAIVSRGLDMIIRRYWRNSEVGNDLKLRVESTPGIRQLLDDVEKPDGSLFIDMRYSSKEPEAEKYDAWRGKYRGLMAWLQAQTLTL